MLMEFPKVTLAEDTLTDAIGVGAGKVYNEKVPDML
jgi:hypothetical protein